MRKLLGVILVLALVAAAVPARADLLRNVRTSGEIQVLGTMDSNAPDLAAGTYNNYSNTSVRVLYGVNAGLAENVKANLTLAYYNMWGQDTPDFGGFTHNGASVQSYLNNVDVVEANVVLKNLFCCLEAKIGRQFYGDEDSAVMYFGPNHYNSEQRDAKQAMSLDGVKLSYAGEALSWDFIYAKVTEMYSTNVTNPTNANANNNDDTSLLGADAKYAFSDNFKLQAYFYQFRNFMNSGFANDPANPGLGVFLPANPAQGTYSPDVYMGIYGVKPSATFDKLNLALEYARNVGGDKPFDMDKNDMWKVDASLDLGAFTPRAQFFRANNIQTFGNYRPGLIIGQFTNNAGFIFSDTALFNLGVDMKFASIDKFTFSLDGFDLRDRNLHGTPTHEADAWVKYQMNRNVELHLAGGFTHIASVPNTYKVQTGMIVRF
ncbi:MAG: hypothetical protein FWF35_01970 [Elusimicrobia bacterium]|nr:hypothetical protein [Elusimicrobiota bacterium]